MMIYLVVSTPFENYARQKWESSPQTRVNIKKNIWVATT